MASRHICWLLSLTALVATAGCVKAPERLPPPAHEPAVKFEGAPPPSNRRVLGGHDFLIVPGVHQPWIQRSSYVIAGRVKREIRMMVEDLDVRLQNDLLLVDGNQYGRLAPSSSVVIEHGIVKVNGKQVEGRPWKDMDLVLLQEALTQ